MSTTKNSPAQWGKYKYFKKEEFDCKVTGFNEMKHEFMLKLDELREACGFPFVIQSGFRDKTHPIEHRKVRPGTHYMGLAADIAASHGNAYILIRESIRLGFGGIGVKQKGSGTRFIHVDTAESASDMPRPLVWSY